MVSITGGLGDLIVIGRFLRDLFESAGPFEFDVFCPTPEMARWVYQNLPGFGAAHLDVFQEAARSAYDIHLSLNQLAIVHYETVRWRNLNKHPRLLDVIRSIIQTRNRGLEPYVVNHPRLDNGLARRAIKLGWDRRNFLHHMAGIDYGGDQIDIESDESAVDELSLRDVEFITVHNGFDTNFIITERRATKCYPHFTDVVGRIKVMRPDVKVVQIGTTTSVPIDGVDFNLIGKTTLPLVAGLLKNSTLHMDNEGGLVHLASALGRRSLVVFGPTPSQYFGYPDNINIDPKTCGDCWWLDELWMNRCMRGFNEPICMYSQPPGAVAELAIKHLTIQTERGRLRVIGASK
jgi:hypothetical protein